MPSVREHKALIKAVQDQIGSLGSAISTLDSKISAVGQEKQEVIHAATSSGSLPETEAINQVKFVLQSQKEDAGAVLEGLQARLGEALSSYRDHLAERAQAEVDRILQQIRETLQAIANFRVELTRLSMTLRGTDWAGNAMSGPDEIGISRDLVYQYSSIPVPQACSVKPPPLNYNPKDFMRPQREITQALKALRAIEKMSADQVLELAKKSEDS